MYPIKMDPWKNTEEHISDNPCNEFEDNFEPDITMDRLPDSEKYLAILEEKLHKLKTDPNIIAQLSKKREDCFNQLLSSDYISPENMELDEPIDSPAILRTILPQKQALTHGEIAELLKYDQFTKSETTDNLSEQQTKSD